MSTEPINYEAVIADLEAKRDHLDATIAAIRAIAAMGSLGIDYAKAKVSSSPGGGKFASDAFFGKSIPDAAVTILQSERRKMSTQALMDTMEKGGLPPSKYNTVYSILRRRESVVGDLINMQGEWGLAAWYPNHVKKAKKEPVSLNPKTFETGLDESPSEDAEYEAGLEKDTPA
jgi:hypothetical protein